MFAAEAGFLIGKSVPPVPPGQSAEPPSVAVTDSADPDVQMLRRLQCRLAAVLALFDSVAVDTILADEMRSINTGDTLLDKPALFRLLRQPAPGVELLGAVDDSLYIRRYGRAAILSARETITQRAGTRELDGRLRLTEVWLKRSGQWRVVGGQATRIP